MKFDIRNQSDNSADIFFYGDILSNDSEAFWGYDEVVPSDVVKQLAELKGKDLNIHISSAGGSVFGGMTIYNAISSLKCRKTVYVDGCACSIASVIAMVGDKIVMPNNSMLMIHPAFCSCCANAEGMRKQAELLEKIDGQILDIYKTRLRDDYNVEDLKALIEAESWLTAKECAEIFNNIELVDEQVEVFAKADKSDFFKNYKNIPSELLAQLEEEAKAEDEEVVEDGCKKKPDDKCEKDDKKCLAMKCPECDYEGEFDVDEEGNYVCPKCGFKLEPDTDDDMEVEDGCKTDDEKDKCDDEKDACKKKEKAQAEAKKQLDFLKAKMFLDNYK